MPTSITPPPADDEIECGNCGGYFHYELTRCPHCGVNVYGSDEDGGRPAPGRSAPAPHRRAASEKVEDFLRRVFKKPYPADELFGAAIDQAHLFNDLLLKVGGDRAAAERLIDFERGKMPSGTRLAWIQNAIRRWEQDNRYPRNS
jgi:hypothetical protein